jgi:hypothetical protein
MAALTTSTRDVVGAITAHPLSRNTLNVLRYDAGGTANAWQNTTHGALAPGAAAAGGK